MPSAIEQIYAIELLSSKPITFDNETLYNALRQQFSGVELVSPSDGKKQLPLFAFPEYSVEFEEGFVPVQIALFPSDDEPIDHDLYAKSVQQTWDWENVGDVVSKCHHRALITDLLATRLDRHSRLELMQKVIQALLSIIDCEAIHWRPSQKMVNPQAFLHNQTAPDPDPLYGALNVRLFNIQDSTPPAFVMDTMGLAVLGLPDIQCHFTGLAPEAIANLLYSLGYYLLDKGDVINDGETVQGLTLDDRWECQHEVALVAPERDILDINPGKLYAVGDRD
jgi:hypothetical protein